MKYPVLNDFIEKYHNDALYKKGDLYPKDGFEADPERVKYLQSDKNQYKIPFLDSALEEEETEDSEVNKERTDESTGEKKTSRTRKKTPAKK